MKRRIIHLGSLALILMVLFSGCVGNRRLSYIQEDDTRRSRMDQQDTSFEVPEYEYTLKKGDVVSVSIKKFIVGEEIFFISNYDPSSSVASSSHPSIGGFLIDSVGNISLPLLGDVMAAGQTLNALKAELTRLSQVEYPGSVAEVALMNGKATILGDIKDPGVYPLYDGGAGIFELLALSGGMNTYADRKQVKVVRTVEGQTKIFHLNLNDVNTLKDANVTIVNGDIVIVSSLERKKFVATNFQWVFSGIGVLVATATLIITTTSR